VGGGALLALPALHRRAGAARHPHGRAHGCRGKPEPARQHAHHAGQPRVQDAVLEHALPRGASRRVVGALPCARPPAPRAEAAPGLPVDELLAGAPRDRRPGAARPARATRGRAAVNGRVLIVGAGQAGGRTAQALRRLGHAGPVTLVGDEALPPYERPPLSKEVLLGRAEPASLLLMQDAGWSELGVELRRSARAVAIERGARRVRLDDSSTLD